MFIREIIGKKKGSDQNLVYHQLIESVRTIRGLQQRPLFYLGKLGLPPEEWETLANRIEEILSRKHPSGTPPDHIAQLALHYVRLLRRRDDGLHNILT